jgi:hypothetical protein
MPRRYAPELGPQGGRHLAHSQGGSFTDPLPPRQPMAYGGAARTMRRGEHEYRPASPATPGERKNRWWLISPGAGERRDHPLLQREWPDPRDPALRPAVRAGPRLRRRARPTPRATVTSATRARWRTAGRPGLGAGRAGLPGVPVPAWPSLDPAWWPGPADYEHHVMRGQPAAGNHLSHADDRRLSRCGNARQQA